MMQLPYALRPWQMTAARKFAEVAAKRPNCRAIVQAATGAGKSRAAYAIGLALGRRFFIVVHLDTLATQFEEEAKRLFPDIKVGVIKAARSETDADLCILSAQTMKDPDRLAALKASEERRGAFALQVHDEVHHATRGSVYDKILQAFPDTPALGLSATLNRTDGKDLAECWPDGVVSRYPILQAQEDGTLVHITDGRGGPKNVPHRLVVPGIDVKAAIAADKAGDREGARRAIGSVAWPIVSRELAFMTQNSGRSICFSPDVESAHIIAEQASQLGVAAVAVDGKMPKKEVRRRLSDFKAGKIQAAVSCAVLLEGFDDRDVRGVLWSRPTLSQTVYIQGVGRGLRASPETGKVALHVSDLCGAHDAHGLITAESLFIEGAPTAEAETPVEALEVGETEKKTDEAEDRKSQVWRNFLACLSGSRCLASATRGPKVALLQMGKSDRTHVYAAADRSIYFLERLEDGRAYVVKEPPGRDQPAIRLCRPMPADEAQDLLERAARAGEGIDNREAAWREKAASDAQLNALARLKVKVDGALTSGEASDLATIRIAQMKARDRGKRGVIMGGAGAFEVES